MPSPSRHLVFVCTGNTCRSPMAEVMMRELLPENSPWKVSSAGVVAGVGAPASELARRVVAEQDLDLSAHVSTPVDVDLVEEADLLVTLTNGHREVVLRTFGAAEDKVRTLHSFGSEKPEADVMDPFGGTLDTYRLTRDEIAGALADVLLSLPDVGTAPTQPHGEDAE